MTECLFCRIIVGSAPGTIVYQDQMVTAFRDIHPVAPTHILIVPNAHIASVNELKEEDELVVGHMFRVAKDLARQAGIQDTGYRMIVNTGKNAGQAVFHLHLHLIGGRHMRFPMG